MSKMAGVVLILSGLAVAVYGLSSEEDANGSDAARLLEVAKNPKVAATDTQSAPLPQPAMRSAASAARIEPVPASSPPVVVMLPPRPSDTAAALPRTAAIPKDRDSLARELQKELRRVGCYEGELNGAWTLATRRAMKTFTDRLNATLPVDAPDAVLFAMVQSQQDRVCGKPCPVDQGLSEDGRCLPNAILAKAARKPWPSAVATHVPASGGPAASKPLSARSWSATVTAVQPTPPTVGAPATWTPPPALAVIAPAPAAPPPTEGRMALAGPTPQQAPPGTAPAPGSSAPAEPLATPRLPLPPKRVVQGNESWKRLMNARRYDSPN